MKIICDEEIFYNLMGFIYVGGRIMNMYNRIVMPSALHGCEAWKINARLRKKVDVLIMYCLRPKRGVIAWGRKRNEDVRTVYGLKYKLSESVN